MVQELEHFIYDSKGYESFLQLLSPTRRSILEQDAEPFNVFSRDSQLLGFVLGDDGPELPLTLSF